MNNPRKGKLEKCIKSNQLSKTGLNEKVQEGVTIGILLIAIVSPILYWQGYFEFLSPEIKISLVDVDKRTESNFQVFFIGEGINLEEEERCMGTGIRIYFTLVNSGNMDGYINVRLDLREVELVSDRYFVREGEEVRKSITGFTPYCFFDNSSLQLFTTVEEP